MPVTENQRKLIEPYHANLFAANKTPINLYGIQKLDLNFGLRRNFTWTFIMAEVNSAIIGAFLDHYKLIVDITNSKLIDGTTHLAAIGEVKFLSSPSITVIGEVNKYTHLLAEFKEILTIPENKPIVDSSTFHHIITKGPPIRERARRLSPNRLKVAKQEFEYWMKKGICRPSKSPWAAPLHMAKKTSTWRPCGDYHRLNSVTLPDRYPVPHIQDLTSFLAGKTILSTIDLEKAYNQIPLNPEDIPKTAIITPFVLFEFLYMTFDLCNAAQTFQRHMHQVLNALDFVFPYIDDILIASENSIQHEQHLKMVFQRLKEHGMSVNLDKCKFGQKEVQFLGYLITSKGILPLPEKVDVIKQFKKPTIAKDLRRFINVINFYRRFIPKAVDTQMILQSLIQGNVKNDKRPIEWTPVAETAFEEFKNKLANATLLAHPIENAKLVLAVDASDNCIGGALHQITNNEVQPLGFYSTKLKSAEKKYSTYDREPLAIYKGIKHFKHMLEARPFTVFTDHKPICFAFKQNSEKATPRQLRRLDFIGQFTTDIQHVRGIENVVPDFLSRIEAIKATA